MTDREIMEAKIKNAPRQVHLAIFSATLLGLLLAVRGTLNAMDAGTFSGRTILFCFLMFGFFASNAISLFKSTRASYVLIAVAALLPVLGSLVGAFHLFAMALTARLGTSTVDSLASVIAVVQLILIVLLYVGLLSTSTRRYVWNPDTNNDLGLVPESPSTSEASSLPHKIKRAS